GPGAGRQHGPRRPARAGAEPGRQERGAGGGPPLAGRAVRPGPAPGDRERPGLRRLPRRSARGRVGRGRRGPAQRQQAPGDGRAGELPLQPERGLHRRLPRLDALGRAEASGDAAVRDSVRRLTAGDRGMAELTQFEGHGARRVGASGAKPERRGEARASGRVRMAPATAELIRNRALAKGDVLEVARLAGIMAAKRTGDLIPLCHPLPITSATVDFAFEGDSTLRIEATVRIFGRTGVEMEALTAVSVAALTVY